MTTSSEPATRTVELDGSVGVRLTLGLMRRGPGDPTMRYDGARTWRTSRMPSGPVTYVLDQVSPTVVRGTAWGDGADEMLDGLPDLLGAQDDPTGFVPRHPVLADGARRFAGLRVPRSGRVLEALIPAVLEQKVLGIDAFAAWRRLNLRFGEIAPGPAPTGMRVVPDAEAWAAIPSWEWYLAGVDPARARTAQACARLGAQLERLARQHPDDHGAVHRGLRSIPGVGRWTSAEVAVRALGDADAVPFGDFHVAKDVGVALVGRPVDDDEMAEVLEPWRPHRYRVVQLVRLSPLVRTERRGPRMSRVDHRRI